MHTVHIYGKKIGILRPLARSSTISDTNSTMDEEAMEKKEEYENSPKMGKNLQWPKNL
jgi:hypothetical protein